LSKKGHDPAKVLPFRKNSVAQERKPASIIDVNASPVQRRPALTETQLRAAVARVIRHGTWLQSRHAAEDRGYRNISDDDIEAALTGPWTLARKPEWSEPYQNWKYRLDGKDIEGDDLTLIITVNEEEITIFVVTKY